MNGGNGQPNRSLTQLCISGLIVLLFWSLFSKAEEGRDTGQREQALSEQVSEESTVTGAEITLKDYQAIEKRPLFHPTRRPRPKQSDDSDSGVLNEKWKLVGIVMKQQEPIALFATRVKGQSVRVEVEKMLEPGWTVEEIQTDHVIVGDGSDSVRFELWEPREIVDPRKKETQRRDKRAKATPDLRPAVTQPGIGNKSTEGEQ